MNGRKTPAGAMVWLSRSNLEELLAKLNGHPPDSGRALFRACDELGMLVVYAEEDEDHYNSQDRERDMRGIRGETYSDVTGTRDAISTRRPREAPGQGLL